MFNVIIMIARARMMIVRWWLLKLLNDTMTELNVHDLAPIRSVQ